MIDVALDITKAESGRGSPNVFSSAKTAEPWGISLLWLD